MNETVSREAKNANGFPGGRQALWLGGALLAGLAVVVAVTTFESSRRAKLESVVEVVPTEKNHE